MFRFTIIPLILLFGGIIFSLIGYVVYRKIKKGFKYTYDKSTEFSSQYMDKWRNQEQRKKLPKIVQRGFDDVQIIENTINQLPPVWQLKLLPLKQKSNSLLIEITQHLIEDEEFERSKLTSLRSFFNHSLDALKQFSQKLLINNQTLTDEETERVKENIRVIYNDLLHHEKILHKKSKLDFDILMDVIKARLKS